MPSDRFAPYPLPSHISHNDYRKNAKPIMEKRRRERINRSLEELKNLILDNATTNNVRSHKLEKADILEMTVKHLRTVYKQKLASAAAVDPTIASKYRAGYGECANEIIRFLTTTPNADLELKTKLITHLSTRIQNLSSLSILPPMQPSLSQINSAAGLLTKTDRYSVNSSTNNQYIFILPQQQQKLQNSSTTFDDDADCSSTSSNNLSDCESMKSSEAITTTPTDSVTSTMTESPSKVWRPW
ncbi:unnamed protein product [Rotaria socialis]|uniref:Uncharacterized protein n=1 Tax=Rotaria socialis TaxID=392032 RepID=A0A820ECT2_9BILA|nr:unnamed protein product [Rotaria socialis]CAF3327161.1 unnamed protein product [Rotaria socialis]CAF3378473.1 unnamed protein product [Rotaria socialis]CAF3410762.1 unnamed protein product [Rotaria socialis]CAF3676588.1 unnamed protein product [Rotaria socialis]